MTTQKRIIPGCRSFSRTTDYNLERYSIIASTEALPTSRSVLVLITDIVRNLVEVRELRDLLPEAEHDVLVLGEAGGAAVALALEHARAQRQAVEVVRVQVAVVVDI